MKNIIDVRNLIFEYFRRNETGEVENIVEALSDVNLQVEKGAFVSIVGANGSGKSTLAKNLNALLLPTEGMVIVDGRDTRDADKRLEVRKSAGMVFQNPDNQIVGTTVETDVSFGPENLGVESEEIVRRVETVLNLVGLSNKKRISTAKLSGGQKQKLAIAGVLAMRPECMILDEATAMLDAEAREKIMRIVHGLNKEYGMTIIHITHFMEEIFDSDYIYVMKEGKIACEGTPEQILAQPKKIQECHLECPA
ncbi:MAG: energy-coupling factor transporter ATPase, partial [Lachnospiraceae bacterium]|nr:energy-coupling factor transporter ATPase [Lachnospiraceae bacterium]